MFLLTVVSSILHYSLTSILIIGKIIHRYAGIFSYLFKATDYCPFVRQHNWKILNHLDVTVSNLLTQIHTLQVHLNICNNVK